MSNLLHDPCPDAESPPARQRLLSASAWLCGMTCWALILARVFLGAEHL